jgi:GNAT superfamily N-acetyltransferase
MSSASNTQLRDEYDVQVRANITPDGSGSSVDAAPNWVRWAANEGLGWSEVAWTDLSEDDVQEAIDAQLAFFRERAQSFVWRVHDYDEPANLGARLLDAGFTFSGTSSVMIASASALAVPSPLPDGTELLEVHDVAGVDLLIETHETVFAHDHQDLRRSILARLDRAPEETEMFVVLANGAPVCAARIEFLPGREFAALWGGGTTPEWRGRGIYRALVSLRARRATQRGYRYLFVLASDQSRPILTTLGFEDVATVSTYSWEPSP